MTEDLQTTLDKLQPLLDKLENTLTEEIQLLSQAHINPVSLQVVSDNKNRLLSTINFYDEQRKQAEKQAQVKAPYSSQSHLAARWEEVTQVARHASELNQKSQQLIEIHMKKTKELKKIIQSMGNASALYGENGDSDDQGQGRACCVSV